MSSMTQPSPSNLPFSKYLRYFQSMLDCGGNVSLTSEEFLRAAKQCLAVEGEAQTKGGLHPDVAQVLRGLSLFMIKSGAEAKEAFERNDRSRTGRLEPRELLQMFSNQWLRNPLSDSALRHVSVQLYMSFMDGDGTLSFRELVKVKETICSINSLQTSSPFSLCRLPPNGWILFSSSSPPQILHLLSSLRLCGRLTSRPPISSTRLDSGPRSRLQRSKY